MKSLNVLTLCAMALAMPAVVKADMGAEGVPAAAAPAEEKEWSVTVGFDIYSEYIFRGVRIPDNDPMFSPSACFAYKGLSIWYWGAFGEGEGNNDTYEENDLGADYTLTFLDDKLSVTAGALMYWYPDGGNASGIDTFEVYGSAGYDCLLQPAVSLYYDVDEFRGGYLTFSIGHSFDVGQLIELKEPAAWSLDLSAALSFDLGYNDRSTAHDFEPNDILLGCSTTYTINQYWSVHAGVQYSVALDALHHIGQSDPRVIGNAGVSLSF